MCRLSSVLPYYKSHIFKESLYLIQVPVELLLTWKRYMKCYIQVKVHTLSFHKLLGQTCEGIRQNTVLLVAE